MRETITAARGVRAVRLGVVYTARPEGGLPALGCVSGAVENDRMRPPEPNITAFEGGSRTKREVFA